MTALTVAERRRLEDPDLLWGWKPLRESDREVELQWRGRRGEKGQHGRFLQGQRYWRKVPLDVLMLVDALDSEFGDRVSFWVSDYDSPAPDPFLMVAGINMHRVIAVWDEPDFSPSIVDWNGCET